MDNKFVGLMETKGFYGISWQYDFVPYVVEGLLLHQPHLLRLMADLDNHSAIIIYSLAHRPEHGFI